MALVPFAHGSGSTLGETVGGLTFYSPLSSGMGNSAHLGTVEAFVQTPWRTPGVLSHLTMRVVTNDRGDSTIRSRVNGSNGAQSITVPSSTTGIFQDATNSDTLSAGDLVNASVAIGSGGSTFTARSVGASFTGTSHDGVRYGRSYQSGNIAHDSVARIVGAGGSGWISSSASVPLQTAAGTYRDAAVWCNTNSRDGAATVTFRVNGVDSALQVTIPTATTGTFTNTADTAVVDALDLVQWYASISGTSGGISQHVVSVGFESAGTSANWMATGDPTAVAAGATHYGVPSGDLSTLPTSETEAQVVLPTATVATGLSANVPTNSSSGGGSVVLRQNGSDVALSLAIPSSTTGWFQAVAGSVSLSALDLLAMKVVAAAGTGSITLRSVTMTITNDPPPIIGSAVFGAHGTPTSSLTVLMNLDGSTRTIHKPNAFVVWGDVFFHTLPASDPGVSGQLWNDSGTLKISSG